MWLIVIAVLSSAIILGALFWHEVRRHEKAVEQIQGYLKQFENPQGCPDAPQLYELGLEVFEAFGPASDEFNQTALRKFHSQAVHGLEVYISKEHGRTPVRNFLSKLERLKGRISGDLKVVQAGFEATLLHERMQQLQTV